ncbi:MAG: peptidoglycan editing factor PgeF [Rhizobiales bacterium]|nr:peptidoglycan editing factor PgeF [Hyphomicrobiales bacterium]
MAEYLTGRDLAGAGGAHHAFFTRRGGVSDGLYRSLNGGVGSKDDRTAVAENRARMAVALGVDPERLLTPYQIHSARAEIVDEPWRDPANRPQCDALVTATPGLAIAVNTADCAPVLLHDPLAGVVGAAHAGWKGAVAGVVEATVLAMESCGARRDSIFAAVGPCISGPNYEVGERFRTEFLERDPEAAGYFLLPHAESKPHFDLPGYVTGQLARLGIAQIEAVSACTYQDPERFFSYRRSTHLGEPDYGRQISAIVLV